MTKIQYNREAVEKQRYKVIRPGREYGFRV